MNLNDNIKNAFTVVSKTYENVNKLMNEMDALSSECGYEPILPNKFLRWKSDIDYNGWFMKSFIKLYQYKDAKKCSGGSGLKNDYIYVVEISLENDAIIYISRYTYEDIDSWQFSFSVSDHWGFYYPVNSENGFIEEELEERYCKSRPESDRIKEKYWNLVEVIYKCENLVDVNGDNIKEYIFKEFDRLKVMKCI